ncbi:MAG: hypothetical protein MZU91_00375 [Desulfosudis oleivorans]|nr:hypothetical protein [Desulfosudis oleivorans]
MQSLSEALVRPEGIPERKGRPAHRPGKGYIPPGAFRRDSRRRPRTEAARKLSFLTMEIGTIRQEKESVTALRSAKTAEITAIRGTAGGPAG